VYSPNWDRCQAFCREMEPQAKCPVVPMKKPEDVMKGRRWSWPPRISLEHVILGKWIEKGMYLCSVKPGEIDQQAYDRCDLIVMHTHQLEPNHYLATEAGRSLLGSPRRGASFSRPRFKGIAWDTLPLLCGRHPWKRTDSHLRRSDHLLQQ